MKRKHFFGLSIDHHGESLTLAYFSTKRGALKAHKALGDDVVTPVTVDRWEVDAHGLAVVVGEVQP